MARRRTYVRDLLGRFATVNGGRARATVRPVRPITSAVHQFGTRGDTRLANRVGRYGRGIGQKFVGGIVEASLEGAQRHALDSLAGRHVGPPKARPSRTRDVGSIKPTTFNRYGRARNRALNRMNTVRFGSTGRRAKAGLRTIRTTGSHARTRVRNSGPAIGIRTLRDARMGRKIQKLNQRHSARRSGPGARAFPPSVVRKQRRARARAVRRL